MRLGVAALLCALVLLAGCGGGDDCELACSRSSQALTCGEGSISCTRSFDQFGRVTNVSCSYSNGPSFSCSFTYNSLGQVTSGSCTGEGKSCSF